MATSRAWTGACWSTTLWLTSARGGWCSPGSRRRHLHTPRSTQNPPMCAELGVGPYPVPYGQAHSGAAPRVRIALFSWAAMLVWVGGDDCGLAHYFCLARVVTIGQRVGGQTRGHLAGTGRPASPVLRLSWNLVANRSTGSSSPFDAPRAWPPTPPTSLPTRRPSDVNLTGEAAEQPHWSALCPHWRHTRARPG